MDTVALVGRLLVSLAAVLGVMWVIARRARKGMKGKGERVIEVLDRATLSRNASVAVVRVNDRAFVIGIADAQVSMLGETELGAALTAKGDAPAQPSRRATHRNGRPTKNIPRPPHNPRVVDPAPSGREKIDHSNLNRPLAGTTGTTGTAATAPAAAQTGALAGSALSPQTWKQTIESLRDLTTRT